MVIEDEVRLAVASQDHGPDRQIVNAHAPNPTVTGPDQASPRRESFSGQPPV
jgi:hypothetical protein